MPKKQADERAPSRGEPTAASSFFDQAMQLLERLKRTQADVIQQAADLCTDRIAKGGLVFLFGNGDSRMMCEEMTLRQCCFSGFAALVHIASSNQSAIMRVDGLRATLYMVNYERDAEQ